MGKAKLELEIDYDEETGMGFVTSDAPLKGRRIRVAINGDKAEIQLIDTFSGVYVPPHKVSDTL